MFKKIYHYVNFIVWKNIHGSTKKNIEFWQINRLNEIINHAHSKSIFYLNAWNKKLRWVMIQNLSDIKNFPIISKRDFRNLEIEEYICAEKNQPFHWENTSGSTGEPFSFASTRYISSPYVVFLNYRFLFWKNFSLKKVRALPIMILDVNKNVGKTFFNIKYFSADDINTKTEETLKNVFKYNPILIESFPSFLMDFTKAIIKFPQLKNPNLKYIISKGENLTNTHRRFIESNLNCEIFDRYGMEEFGPIATECKCHDGLHISSESFLIEIVDEKGDTVPIGEKGNIIITDFRNYVMPFIRYSPGDEGYFIKEECPCGIPGHKLKIIGRDVEYLHLENKSIHHFEFYDIFKLYSSIVLQYQIVRTNKDTIVLMLVTLTKPDNFLLNSIQKRIEKLVGKKYQIDIKVVSEIKKTPRGKNKTIINIED